MLLQTLLIVSLGITPSLIYLWFRRQVEARAIQQIRSAGTAVPVTSWRQQNMPADAQYVEGVGYLIGDITCKYNAQSSYIRCAINPDGPCENCRYYEPREN